MKEEKYERKGNEKKMDKGTNAKELRNIGISLIIPDRRLSGVYIFKTFSPKAGRNEVCERKRRARGRQMGRGGAEKRKEKKVTG